MAFIYPPPIHARRWLEPELPDGIKWKTLSHSGILFPAPYVPLPQNVYFKYDGERFDLSPEAEEVRSYLHGCAHTHLWIFIS